MLKPLLINKSLRPRALKGKDLKQLPVHWMANPKAWMTTAIFTEWFNNCFVPEVEAYMKEKSLDFKVLLIVDNAASHPQLEHPNVQLVFLPPNTTSLLDQGIIATFKKYYIKTTYKFILNKLENESLTVKDMWKQFSIFDCLFHVASASAQIRPRTLNACWKKIWPACVTDNTTTQTSTLSDEIINLAHEIGGDGFNTFSHDDIDELFVDDALSDNDIIDLTLDLTVDGIVGLEGDNDEEEKSTPLTGKLIQEGLQLCESSSQSLITDYTVRKGRATQNDNEVCESPWPLPQISIAESVSSDDGDLEPLANGANYYQSKEENISKNAAIDFLTADKRNLLLKEKTLQETVMDYTARLAEAAEVYKKQFLMIEKLKKKLKKYKLNPMISSSGEVNSSESRNTALPLEAERSQPQKNISDSDTGEHVSASGQNSNGRCEGGKPLGARPKANASGPSSTSSSLVSENTVDESANPESSICELSSEDISSESSEKSSVGSETLKDVQKTENFEVVELPESSNEDQNVESLLMIPCNFCFEEISISTKTAVNLANHLEKEHKIIICPVCGQLFNSDVPPRYLNYHIEDHFKM
ncbi:tigger transposable element-derived protein 1 [Trichonephila clavipes]|uniref:Tigger transposable element-derived protein 1 n=1 Tax=Trichonephila clavipes TaxID=2585209 RepID=A0A8X6WIQ7_TRICX|nr:tigger transposable element-derived protein 1 [Trichonephila clavipes]